MKISGITKVLGIFGDPVAQTLSPAMHNAAFEALGLSFVYVPFRVRPEELEAAVGAIRALEMPGVNITIPHKEKIIDLLDEIDADAGILGAVNTVLNRDGKLIGYNTDGEGFLKSLTEETGFNPEGKTIIILGAGGAGRGILASFLKKSPGRVVIANRTVEKAEGLVTEFREKFKGAPIEAVGLEKASLDPVLGRADLLVNATSIGMVGQGGQTPLPISIDKLPGSAVVSDIVYRPLTTELIKGAEELGLTVLRGLGMLVHQGALSLELWTGKKAPVDTMRQAALKELEAE
jgi:shikimate dehydrogenase